MVQYQQCPLCGSVNIQHQLTVKDHTVSRQDFDIWQCTGCTGRFTQNIPAESDIGPFYKSDSYISHTNTKTGLINWLYHQVRKKTLRSKRNIITKATGLRNGKVLDIGCGTGAFLNTMKHFGWSVTGLEPDADARKIAAELYQVSPQLPEVLFDFPSLTYNAVTMWHVLEHVHNLHGYLKQISNVLKDDGVLFIAVPNYTAKDAQIYQEHWAAYDVPRHLYHFSPNSMKKILLQHGMQIKKIKPMWFDSFYVCLLSEQYRNGKNNFIKAMWNGLRSNWKAFYNKEKCSSIIYIIEKKV
ncbi:MAG: class I SAM-dependent methyltransferase [Chitinophagaceae bacterium]|nr:class I SAM-dependent methyltransferase [Chitinophagaceae bacterium]